MNIPRGETIADGYDVVNSGRTPRPAPSRRDWHDRHVCKALIPPASPGAIAEHCQAPPVTDDGWCAEHRP